MALLLLIIAYPFYSLGMSFSGSVDTSGETFKVLNYNLMRFRDDENQEVSDWILDQNADVICLQEFGYGTKQGRAIRNFSEYEVFCGGYGKSFAILSKFPIIETGQLFTNNHTNNVIFADLLINKDTVRIYNVHLQSMGINPEKMQSTEGIKNEYENVTNKFLTSSAERTRQINLLLAGSDTLGLRKIMVGDFNDVPFSYNYFQFRKRFKNAFEEVGSGFGVSYNGKIPFLRIDNQFYSEGVAARSLKTINNIYYSDHFPLIGNYEITP